MMMVNSAVCVCRTVQPEATGTGAWIVVLLWLELRLVVVLFGQGAA